MVVRTSSKRAVFGAAPERRPDNVAFYGLLSEADLKCEYTGGAVRITLDAVVVGERGPASKGDSVDLQYFVAVNRPDPEVPRKKPLPRRPGLDPTPKNSRVSDHHQEKIPPPRPQ